MSLLSTSAVWSGPDRNSSIYPRIFVLPLPPIFTCSLSNAYEFKMYGTEKSIPLALARSSFVTSDPADADFFYVPAHIYCTETQLKGAEHKLPLLGEPAVLPGPVLTCARRSAADETHWWWCRSSFGCLCDAAVCLLQAQPEPHTGPLP